MSEEEFYYNKIQKEEQKDIFFNNYVINNFDHETLILENKDFIMWDNLKFVFYKEKKVEEKIEFVENKRDRFKTRFK